MSNNNVQWSNKPDDDEVQKRLHRWHAHLHHDQENSDSKEKFEELTKRAAQPVKPEPGKSAESDSYNGK